MQYRYELKFPIRKDKIHLVDIWINNQIFIKKHYPDREINSCYYDTPFYKTANDNIAGISRRLKFRSRWYNNDKKPFFEVKIKKSTLGTKVICKLDDYDFVNKKISVKNFQNNKDYFYKYLNNLELDPVIQISYIRKYYIRNNIRITLDNNIKYKDLKKNNNSLCFDNSNILEIKFDKIYLNEAKEFFKHFPFRAKRNSKYLRGLSHLKIANYI